MEQARKKIKLGKKGASSGRKRATSKRMDAKEKGIGLKNIENRVHFLNGKLDIETDENGTSVYIEFQDFKTLKLSQIG